MEMDRDFSQESDSPWGKRVPVIVDAQAGLMKAGEAARPVDINGDVSIALSSYLSMVYELRSLSTGVIPLRQEDILSLANAFEMDETDIAERLARLMHCDDLQTHRFIQMVKKGRVLVPVSMVATGAVLAATLLLSSAPSNIDNTTNSRSRATVEVVTPSTTVAPQVSVDIGEATQVERATVTDEVSSPQADDGTLNQESNPAPEVGPGEVVIGGGISVSRDDL